jgi:pyruvate,water dikinase
MKAWFKNLIRSFESAPKISTEEIFRDKYSLFRRVLEAREEALTALASPLQPDFSNAAVRAGKALENLDALAEQSHPDLLMRLQQIEKEDQPLRACSDFQDLLSSTHDLAVEALSALPDTYNTDKLSVKKVQTGLPINLHVLDLEGALPGDSARVIPRDQICSLPLQAMFRGMYHPGITWSGPIGLNLKGLMVIMAQSSSRPEEDFWDKTLALIATEYMNYRSRLGYHYASVDANASAQTSSNHLRFTFKGGAADDLRRARRARFIGTVLERTGFEVEVRGDSVRADFRRRSRTETEERLDLLGRLMGCCRQRDMVMDDDAIVGWHVEAFLRGNYSFSPDL